MKEEIKKDVEKALKIVEGDLESRRAFFDEFSDLVLFRMRKIGGAYCSYKYSNPPCCFQILADEWQGRSSGQSNPQCDKASEAYLWAFNYLLKRLKSYKGLNNATLNTYVHAILFSHNMKVDWLREQHSRINIPRCVQSLSSNCQEVYIQLRLRKQRNAIAKGLNLSAESVDDVITEVYAALSKTGLLDLLIPPSIVSITDKRDDERDGNEIPIPSHDVPPDQFIDLSRFLKKLQDALNRLKSRSKKPYYLLDLYYGKEMTLKEILTYFEKVGINPLIEKKLTEQVVFYQLEKSRDELLRILKEDTPVSWGGNLNEENLKEILNDLGQDLF